MMAERLLELRRVLKPTGTLWLHCDPTASHYLKVLLDAIFGVRNFVNELVWKRSTAHSDARQGAQHLGRLHDVVFVYSKSEAYVFNVLTLSYDEKYVKAKYPFTEPDTGRRYGLWDMSGPGGAAKGNPSYEVLGVTRYWRYSKEKMDQLISEGRVIQPRPGAVPRFKRYLDEGAGVALQDVWTDIDPINSQAAERLGYPTQKPLALLERIVSIGSRPDDVVLDPFAGCGTAIDAAQKLGRRWIGIDITTLAVDLMDARLRHTYGEAMREKYELLGTPLDLEGAQHLFTRSPFEFERWAVMALDGQPNVKQVGDKGVDGVIRIITGGKGQSDRVLISIKGGATNPGHVRDLLGTVEGQKAAMGIFVCMKLPTKDMREVANKSGSYKHPGDGREYPRLQIITVQELLDGQWPKLPPTLLPYFQAQKRQAAADGQMTFGS